MKTIYITKDGQQWDDKSTAEKHEAMLDKTFPVIEWMKWEYDHDKGPFYHPFTLAIDVVKDMVESKNISSDDAYKIVDTLCKVKDGIISKIAEFLVVDEIVERIHRYPSLIEDDLRKRMGKPPIRCERCYIPVKNGNGLSKHGTDWLCSKCIGDDLKKAEKELEKEEKKPSLMIQVRED